MALDPHNLRRFTSEQTHYHPIALAEMQRGRKSSCWAWYILPTPPFLRNGKPAGSAQNRMYELADDEQVRAPLGHSVIRVLARARQPLAFCTPRAVQPRLVAIMGRTRAKR
eukprot:scaffold8307_cov119-Isochrysis_galbana.AAC.10